MAEEKGTAMEKREAAQVMPAERTRPLPTFLPATDICETKHQILVVMDMPGVDKDSISINLEQQVLTVSAEARVQPEEDLTAEYAEYRVGSYERRFTLTELIDRDRIEAEYRDGVLRLTLPKAEQARPRQISIKG